MIQLGGCDCENHQRTAQQPCAIASVVDEEWGQVNHSNVSLLWPTVIAGRALRKLCRFTVITSHAATA